MLIPGRAYSYGGVLIGQINNNIVPNDVVRVVFDKQAALRVQPARPAGIG
jgi:hypothetical protein